MILWKDQSPSLGCSVYTESKPLYAAVSPIQKILGSLQFCLCHAQGPGPHICILSSEDSTRLIGHPEEPLYSRGPWRVILQHSCKLEILISNKYLACQSSPILCCWKNQQATIVLKHNWCTIYEIYYQSFLERYILWHITVDIFFNFYNIVIFALFIKLR